jgi:hypothetical protein
MKDGNKIYQIKIARKKDFVPEIIFRDSFNWLAPLALADLPAALGLSVSDKGWFPYLYNRNENLHVQLDNLPDKELYAYKGMRKKKRKAFKVFYKENAIAKKTPFCLKDALVEYGMQDVRILAHAVIEFRRLFKDISGDDMIENSVTAASACMRYYCTNFIAKGDQNIAIIPENGYSKMTRQSVKALKFLKWVAHSHHTNIRHRDSGGEKYFRGYHLDGYVKAPEGSGCRDLCIEYNGCAWHGHECLYEEEDICPNGKTAALNRAEYEKRRAQISEEMDYVVYWECEVDAEMKRNAAMREYCDSLRDTGPLNPKDAYFGGRTGPTSMKCDLEESPELTENYAIGGLDIVSLYPYIMMTTDYPVGHPTEIIKNETVKWTQPADNPYKGLIKCFVVPPQNLLHPIIPRKIRGKLMFVLCHHCARDGERKSRRMMRDPSRIPTMELCPHSDEERGFVTTVTHLELNAALEKKYVVTHLYAAYHWDEWTRELFAPYIRKWMKIKVESSGWPSSCMDNPSMQKWYVDEWQRRFDIAIDPANVKKNEGMKLIAKICLNCLWGKWSMRNNLSSCLITDSPTELHDLINNKTLDIGVLEYINEHLMMASYKKKASFVIPHSRYNIAISIFTTSAARLRLYSYMDKIASTPGCKLLYTDTGDFHGFRFGVGTIDVFPFRQRVLPFPPRALPH